MTQFPIQMFFPILLMALFAAYAIYAMRKRKAGMGPAFRMFFERTGWLATIGLAILANALLSPM